MKNETIDEYLKRGGEIKKIPEGEKSEQSNTLLDQISRKHKHCNCDNKDTCRVPAEYKVLCSNLDNYLRIVSDIDQQEKVSRIDIDKLSHDAWPATPSTPEVIAELYFLDRLRVTEIADLIGVSHQYVSATIKRQKKILKKNLKK